MNCQIDAFKAKVASDDALRAKISKASGDAEIISIAAAAGFTITENELRV